MLEAQTNLRFNLHYNSKNNNSLMRIFESMKVCRHKIHSRKEKKDRTQLIFCGEIKEYLKKAQKHNNKKRTTPPKLSGNQKLTFSEICLADRVFSEVNTEQHPSRERTPFCIRTI